MQRKEQLFIPLSDAEKQAVKNAADANHSPLATWARGALMREAARVASKRDAFASMAPVTIQRNDEVQ